MGNHKNGRAALKRLLPALPHPSLASIRKSLAKRFHRSESDGLRSVEGRVPTPYRGRSVNDLSVMDSISDYEQSIDMQTGLRQPFRGSSETLFERVHSAPGDVVRARETLSHTGDPTETSRSLENAPNQAVEDVEDPLAHPRLRHPLRIPQRLSGSRHGQDTSPTQASSSGTQRTTLRTLYLDTDHRGPYPPQPWSGSGINTIDPEPALRPDPEVPSLLRLYGGPQLSPNTQSAAGYEFFNMHDWRQAEDEELEASGEAEELTSPPSEEVLSAWNELREDAKVNRMDRNGRCVSDSDGNSDVGGGSGSFPSAAVRSMIS